jgi:hypothetical protein
VQLGGGRDNKIAGNIFVDTKYAIGLDARYIGWASKFAGTLRDRLAAMPYATPPWSDRYPKLAVPMRHDVWPEGDEFSGNIVGTTAPPAANPAQSNTFPANALATFEVPSDAVTIDRNIYWNSGGPVNIRRRFIDLDGKWMTLSLDDWQKTGLDRNSVAADPLFVYATHDDFRLRPNSPAHKLGFQNIPWNQIGLLPSFPATWRNADDQHSNEPIPATTYRYPLELSAKD